MTLLSPMKRQSPLQPGSSTWTFKKAVRDLKHDPKVSPKEGIRKTVAWMKENYPIGK
ncbi:MAG: hypothetical protein WCG82_11940 [Bacteroidota bacterium]